MNESKTLICKTDLDENEVNTAFIQEIHGAVDLLGVFSGSIDNFVDVGGHYGGHVFAAHHKGVKRIYCFEASYINCVLTQNLMSTNKIPLSSYKIFNLAAFNESGKITKLKKVQNKKGAEPESGQYSIINYDHRSDFNLSEEYESCMTVSVEDMFELCGSEIINIMKVDIEGAEYDFLMNKDLSNINYMYIEFHLSPEKNKELGEHLGKYFEIANAYTHRNDRHFSVTDEHYVNIKDIDFSMEIFHMFLVNKRISQQTMTTLKENIKDEDVFADETCP